MAKSNQSPGQIAQFSYDPNNQAIKVTSVTGALITEAFDYIAVAYPSGVQEVYTYKIGGVGGTTVATLTVNYTDVSKSNIQDIAKT